MLRLVGIGRSTGAPAAAVALNSTLRREGVIAIPKAANAEHVLENRRARDFELDADELRRLDQSQRRASRRRRLSFLERI